MNTNNYDIKNISSIEELEKIYKTDLDQLKNIFNEAQQNQQETENKQNGNDRYLSLPLGKTTVRILPPLPGKRSFFKEFMIHIIGRRIVVCQRERKYDRKNQTSKCHICSVVNRLYKKYYINKLEKNENSQDIGENEELRMICYGLKSNQKVLYNVIVRGFEISNEEKKFKIDNFNFDKPYFLTAGIKLHEKIRNFVLNENIDITNIKNGYDLVIIKEIVKSRDGRLFPHYESSYFKMYPSPLSENIEKIKLYLNQLNDYNLEEEIERRKINEAEAEKLLVEYFTNIGREDLLEYLHNKEKENNKVIITQNPIDKNINSENIDDDSITNTDTNKDDVGNNDININLEEFEKELLSGSDS